MTDKFKDYMKSDDILFEEEDFDSISSGYDNFFTEVGDLLDSLDSEDVSDDTHDLIDELVDKIFDVIISLGDEDFDEDTEEQFMDLVHMLDLDDEIDESERLTVKSRKVKSGRRRSQKSRLKGSDKLKYLKNLKKKRKEYKKKASIRNKVKKKSKRYRKTSQARNVKNRYKRAQGKK